MCRKILSIFNNTVPASCIRMGNLREVPGDASLRNGDSLCHMLLPLLSKILKQDGF